VTSQELIKALDYLYSFIDYGVKRSYRYSPEVFDLGRVQALLASLGDPQRMFRSIHIAGTKGKGSVAAMIESCLRAAGYRTGLYTSPHLIEFTERIQVDGKSISDEKLVELIEKLKPHVETVPEISTYELTTALGFMYFAEQQVDCAVVEVGLGGRLDATNVLEPMVSVITSLSYDHMHLLGGSLSDIAREKAGIIKPGIPVVLAPQQFEADGIVRAIAAERGAPVLQVNRDWHYSAESRNLTGQTFNVWQSGNAAESQQLWIPLLGYHQVQNGAVAYVAINQANSRGLPVDLDAVEQGLTSVYWPGRFQVLSDRPAIVLDSAHNRDSALKLRIALDDYFPGRPVTMVFGASSDKDLRGIFLELSPRVSRLILTQSDHPRSEAPELLAKMARSFGMDSEIITPVSLAMQRAVHEAHEDAVVVGTGSLFVVGSALAAWDPEHMVFVSDERALA
jgi:dihydrofolate synthase/folylpolyglutamate synthase